MADNERNSHDQLVVAVAEALRPLGEVHVDVRERRQACPWARRSRALARSSGLLFAAFVPTRAVFAKFAAMNVGDLHWKTPDVVLDVDGKLYVVDICGSRESTVRIARKVENVIASAADSRIHGAAMLHVPAADARPLGKGVDQAFDVMRATFEALFGSTPASATASLRVLLQLPLTRDRYGEVDWSRIMERDADPDWARELVQHAQRCIAHDRPLAFSTASNDGCAAVTR
ncbi:MAG: hypothetical protein HY905_02420 [Deltaproteobacteria bacterium]|nr:hypothetical protein [Deltaproteobacteria bacterium]